MGWPRDVSAGPARIIGRVDGPISRHHGNTARVGADFGNRSGRTVPVPEVAVDDLSERLARIAEAVGDDPRSAHDLEIIRSQLAKLEGKLYRIARRRSTWTRPGPALSMMFDVDLHE